MTQHHKPEHCAFCAYRHAAGTLTIHTSTGPRRHHTCWTCAHEAADYYPTRLGFRVRFSADRSSDSCNDQRMNGRIVDSRGTTVYRIRGERIVDSGGATVYRIRGERIVDSGGATVYRIRDERIVDARGTTVYRIRP